MPSPGRGRTYPAGRRSRRQRGPPVLRACEPPSAPRGPSRASRVERRWADCEPCRRGRVRARPALAHAATAGREPGQHLPRRDRPVAATRTVGTVNCLRPSVRVERLGHAPMAPAVAPGRARCRGPTAPSLFDRARRRRCRRGGAANSISSSPTKRTPTRSAGAGRVRRRRGCRCPSPPASTELAAGRGVGHGAHDRHEVGTRGGLGFEQAAVGIEQRTTCRRRPAPARPRPLDDGDADRAGPARATPWPRPPTGRGARPGWRRPRCRRRSAVGPA